VKWRVEEVERERKREKRGGRWKAIVSKYARGEGVGTGIVEEKEERERVRGVGRETSVAGAN
jgi:hypothetical protein